MPQSPPPPPPPPSHHDSMSSTTVPLHLPSEIQQRLPPRIEITQLLNDGHQRVSIESQNGKPGSRDNNAENTKTIQLPTIIPQTLEPTSRIGQEIGRMEIKRSHPPVDSFGRANPKRAGNTESWLAHSRGDPAPVPCRYCHKGKPKFEGCILLPGYFCGACTNCHINGEDSRCDYYQSSGMYLLSSSSHENQLV
jgi:hypothetical protein